MFKATCTVSFEKHWYKKNKIIMDPYKRRFSNRKLITNVIYKYIFSKFLIATIPYVSGEPAKEFKWKHSVGFGRRGLTKNYRSNAVQTTSVKIKNIWRSFRFFLKVNFQKSNFENGFLWTFFFKESCFSSFPTFSCRLCETYN